jgi:hypothetical protein
MNPEPESNDLPPHAENEPNFRQQSPIFRYDGRLASATTITYYIDEQTWRCNFLHDKAKGLFVLTKPDGTAKRFRDKPARHLVVEPDCETGDMRPAVKGGQPVYLYLCREEREA